MLLLNAQCFFEYLSIHDFAVAVFVAKYSWEEYIYALTIENEEIPLKCQHITKRLVSLFMRQVMNAHINNIPCL